MPTPSDEPAARRSKMSSGARWANRPRSEGPPKHHLTMTHECARTNDISASSLRESRLHLALESGPGRTSRGAVAADAAIPCIYPRATRRPLVAALRAARRPAQCLPPPAPVSPSCCALCPPSARPPLARVRLPHSPRAVAEGAYGASAPARRLLGASSAAAALTAPSPSCHVALFLSSGRAARSVPPHACDRLHCGGGEAPPSLPAPRHAHRARAACVLFRGRGPRAARPPARPLS